MSVGVGVRVGTRLTIGALSGVARASGSDVCCPSPWQAGPAMNATLTPTKNAAPNSVFRKVGIISSIFAKRQLLSSFNSVLANFRRFLYRHHYPRRLAGLGGEGHDHDGGVRGCAG